MIEITNNGFIKSYSGFNTPSKVKIDNWENDWKPRLSRIKRKQIYYNDKKNDDDEKWIIKQIIDILCLNEYDSDSDFDYFD